MDIIKSKCHQYLNIYILFIYNKFLCTIFFSFVKKQEKKVLIANSVSKGGRDKWKSAHNMSLSFYRCNYI